MAFKIVFICSLEEGYFFFQLLSFIFSMCAIYLMEIIQSGRHPFKKSCIYIR